MIDIPNVAASVPAASERESSLVPAQFNKTAVTEQQLLDYVAGLSKGSYASGSTSPAAMSGWIARYFNGFVERASTLKTDIESSRIPGMSDSQDASAAKSDNNVKLASLPSGPAGRELDIAALTGGTSDQPVAALTQNDTVRTLELLLKISGFTTETTLMTSGVTAIMKSTKQLLSGQ
ncbi:MAG: hypothetical protein HC850_06895 [Rhodomicrobium sp.]|nr:hypothetical protein [Rhodomicrobium sp.]